ncbi:antigen 5 like allergen Cul n 1-like [Uranotaenia lowii]|uniref:antigen 5 like allergen Cul n 1-like n=1 Tax=Uranotaenia lowii TaxID=190385 RepID=UPI002479EECD|nr:antigen 5 like allergen Cul n 1-like [Uranotaenia lowii]
MKSILEAILVLGLVHFSLQATNYCDPALCAPSVKHIGCNASTTFGQSTGKLVPLGSSSIFAILDLHNNFRNIVSMGLEKNGNGTYYPQASRMRSMQWDTELASLATINARQCEMKGDACRNTAKYPAAGQNLATYSMYGLNITVDDIANIMIKNWYRYASGGSSQMLQRYPTSGTTIATFTQMVKDTADRVGCAMSTWKDGIWTRYYLVCNYAITNIYGKATYASGKTASGCTQGRNPSYPGLCSINEPSNYQP